MAKLSPNPIPFICLHYVVQAKSFCRLSRSIFHVVAVAKSFPNSIGRRVLLAPVQHSWVLQSDAGVPQKHP